MITNDKVTDIFCTIDEFCKTFKEITKSFILGRRSKRPPGMCDSEVICILVLFHMGGDRCLKHFYISHVQRHMRSDFPSTVSYGRFVELSRGVAMPMAIFLKTCRLGTCSGISFIDSTPIRACGNKRVKRNKVFKGVAAVGKSTMGWFYGFKLHLVINDRGEVLNFAVTRANVDDRDPLKNEGFLKGTSKNSIFFL